LLAGYAIEPASVFKTTRMLEPGELPGRVDVRDIGFHSLCAHHFLPFFGTVDLAYEPGDRILGLGKLPRLVDVYARRFQIQEDLVRQVAHAMMDHGHARGVRVRAQARHLCMCARGPSNPSAVTHTEFALGTLAES
jgi:GTP cyclohydrolase I